MAQHNRRAAILDAAQRLSSQGGLSAVSTAEVCRAARVTNGSMFHFFPTKDALHAALYLKALAGYQETIASGLERERSPRAGVRGIVLGHIDWIVEHPAEARFLDEGRHSSTSLDEEIQAHNRRFLARLSGWFRPRVEAGAIRPLPPDVLVAVVFGPIYTITRKWMGGSGERRLREVAPMLADAAWAAVRKKGR